MNGILEKKRQMSKLVSLMICMIDGLLTVLILFLYRKFEVQVKFNL